MSTSGSILSEAASSFLQVPSIPYAAWIAKLQDAHRKSATDTGAIKDNPALKLFDFFSTMAGKTWPGLDVERAVEASSTLRAAARLERQDVERWMAYWVGGVQEGNKGIIDLSGLQGKDNTACASRRGERQRNHVSGKMRKGQLRRPGRRRCLIALDERERRNPWALTVAPDDDEEFLGADEDGTE